MAKIITGILVFLQSSLFANCFQNLPKAELHLHLGGAFPKEYLFSIATLQQQEHLERNLALVPQGMDYHAIFPVFQLVSQLVNSEEKVQAGVEALCHALQQDRVTYVEIRTGLKDFGHGHEAYLKAVLDGMRNCVSDQFKARLILSVQRNSSLEMAEITVDLALKYQDQGVIGIDLSGDSTLGQIEAILPQLLRAKEKGLIFLVHMGESPKEKDQMLLIKALEPKRIGHGVHLGAEAREWILENRIPVEVCLTSSVLVQMIDRMDQHPGIELFRLGHPVAFCTDDPLIFSTTLSQELLLAHQLGGLTKEEVESVVRSAFDYAASECLR